MNLSEFYSYRIIGKLTVFFLQFQEFCHLNQTIHTVFLISSNLGLEIFSPRFQFYVSTLMYMSVYVVICYMSVTCYMSVICLVLGGVVRVSLYGI